MSLTKDVAESGRVARASRARKGECFQNAFRVIRRLPEYADAYYVEGMVVSASRPLLAGLPYEHGWVEMDGRIIDPTLPSCDAVYFTGLRCRGAAEVMKLKDGPKAFWASRDLPLFYCYGWGGTESVEFRSAVIAAYRFAGQEDTAKRYEEYGRRLAAGEVKELKAT